MSPNGARNRDSLLIAQLAGGATQEHAATAVGCSRRTIARKLQDPKFCAQLDEARRQLFEAAFSRINAAGQAAASTLISLLSRDTPPAVRLGASRTLLETSCKFRETHEIEERLRALEGRLGKP
jgi:hypothetical protein